MSIVVAGGILATTIGCAQSNTRTDSFGYTNVLPVESWSQVDIPLSKYTMSANDWKQVFSAMVLAQNSCLVRYGLPAAAQLSFDRDTWKEIRLYRRYGIWNRSEVEKYGFKSAPATKTDKRAPDSQQQSKIDEAMSGFRNDGSASTLKDTSGKSLSDGGCGKEGWDVVRGGGPEDVEAVPTQLADDSWSKMLLDKRFKDLEASWSSCMKKAGYEISTRWKTGDLGKDEGAQASLRAAVADLTCAEEVNFIGVANQIDAQIQMELIREHEGELRGALEEQKKLVENAKRVSKG